MDFDSVRQIADAVLYEGYSLYPYRASAVKNRQRFNFGVLSPTGAEAHAPSETSHSRTECLVEGDQPSLEVRVRFLHLLAHEVLQPLAPASSAPCGYEAPFTPVPCLTIDDRQYQAWHEAVEREVVIESIDLRDLHDQPRQFAFSFKSSASHEILHDAQGGLAGKLTRRQCRIEGTVTLGVVVRHPDIAMLFVETRNTTGAASAAGSRDDLLLQSLVSSHTILAVHDGQFVSLLEPPEPFAHLAAQCQNDGVWPVLVGDEGERRLLLASPVILYDYPRIAPESTGDYFDGTEMDEMLALRVMTLTAAEKREIRHGDPRTRQMLERTESMSPAQLRHLHGAVRDLKPVPPTGDS